MLWLIPASDTIGDYEDELTYRPQQLYFQLKITLSIYCWWEMKASINSLISRKEIMQIRG